MGWGEKGAVSDNDSSGGDDNGFISNDSVVAEIGGVNDLTDFSVVSMGVVEGIASEDALSEVLPSFMRRGGTFCKRSSVSPLRETFREV